MAVTTRAAHVGPVAHSASRSARSLSDGRKRASKLVLAAVMLLAWGFAFGASPMGVVAAVASTAAAYLVGTALLRDRGEYHRALAVRLVRHAQAATLVTALVVASAALLDTGAAPLRLVAASLLGFLAVAGWDVRQHRTQTTERPLRVLGLGAGEEAARVVRSFENREAHGVQLVGFVGNHSHAVVPILGELDDLADVVRRFEIDAIVLTASTQRLPLLEHLLDVESTPAVLELSDLYERAFGCVPVEEINAAWFIEALTLHRRLQNSPARRIVDIVVSALAAVALAPVMAIVALAIKLDTPGPVFYRQVRVGEGGRRFVDHQVPLDAHRRRGPPAPPSGLPSPIRAITARRPLHPPLPHRRAAPAVERRSRRDGARRAASRASRAGRRDRPRSCPSTSRATSSAPASPGGPRSTTRPTQRPSRRRSRNCPTTSTTSSTNRSPPTPESCSAPWESWPADVGPADCLSCRRKKRKRGESSCVPLVSSFRSSHLRFA